MRKLMVSVIAKNIATPRNRGTNKMEKTLTGARRPVATSALFRCRLAMVPSERATVESEQDGGYIVRDQTAASRCGF